MFWSQPSGNRKDNKQEREKPDIVWIGSSNSITAVSRHGCIRGAEVALGYGVSCPVSVSKQKVSSSETKLHRTRAYIELK